MIIKHSFSLTASNIHLIAKLFLYLIIIAIILAAVFISVTDPIYKAIGRSMDFHSEIELFAQKVLDGKSNIFQEIVTQMHGLLSAQNQKIAATAAYLCITLFLFRFFKNFAIVPAAYCIMNKMESNLKIGFANALVATAGKAALYSHLYALITVPMDFAIALGGYYLLIFLIDGIGFFGGTIAISIILLLYCVRLTLFSQWLPSMILENTKVLSAFRKNFRKSRRVFSALFPAYFIVVLMMFGIVAAAGVMTFFILPIVAFPAFSLLTCAMDTIACFRSEGRKYYIDENVIVG